MTFQLILNKVFFINNDIKLLELFLLLL